MERSGAKYASQVGLIARLGEFAGTVTPGYINQKEFFIATLQNMSEHLLDLKRETLKEACAAFCAKLDRDAVTDEVLFEFKSLLDKIVTGKDFNLAAGCMAASKQVIKTRLAALEPFSITEEAGKERNADPTANRLITDAYRRLKFEALEHELAKGVSDSAIDSLLTKARANVAEYCCLYQVPLRTDDTLTPFSLSRIDGVVGACHVLLSRIRDIMARNR